MSVSLVVLCLGAAAPASAQPLTFGFLDEDQTGPAATANPWLQRAIASGADMARISASWANAAPSRPADPTDPSDPAYHWDSLDQSVRVVVAAGLAPFVTLTGAPAWAEGPRRPADARGGTWRPDAEAYRSFAQALARRYDGTWPDPARMGALIPRVRSFEAWNEPNLDTYLGPQWVKRGRGFVNTGPVIFRNLLNGFYRGIKASQPSATVVSGGTSSFGDPQPGGKRTMPARFVRTMLCLDRRLRPTCSNTTHFDALSHHPFPGRGPADPALNEDDVSVPDLRKLTRLVTAAVRIGHALPRRSKALWATELAYDSSPPDPNGVPLARHARDSELMLALLQRQGARVVIWFQIHDQLPQPSFAVSRQSGPYFFDGRPKPLQRAFAFPLVVTGTARTTARLWLRAPATGSVHLERRVAGRWVSAGSVQAGRHAVIERNVRRAGATAFRARQGTRTSLAWRI